MNPQAPTNEVREILRKRQFDQADVDKLVEGIESLTIEEKVRLLFTITGYQILSNNPRNFTIAERVQAGVRVEKEGDERIPPGPEDVGGDKTIPVLATVKGQEDKDSSEDKDSEGKVVAPKKVIK